MEYFMVRRPRKDELDHIKDYLSVKFTKKN